MVKLCTLLMKWYDTVVQKIPSHILLGDLNVDLDHPKDIRDDNIISMMVLLGLDDIGDHFAHPPGRWTWSMRRENNSGFGVRDFFSSDQFRKLLFVSHEVANP
jgi:hypothetical protein